MPEQLTRDQIIEALREMPADATADDAIERIIFLAKIEEGLSELEAAKVFRTPKPSAALACEAHPLVSAIAADLETQRTYIASASEHYADLTIRRIVAAVDRLEQFPL